MMKKYAVIGRGTVGCVSALQMKLNFPDAKVEWHFDPSIKPQAVGEGSTLPLPVVLNQSLGFGPKDFPSVDGYIKTGIFKRGWSATSKEFLHEFPSPAVALHFNANKMQDYIYGRLKDHVDLFEQNITPDEIDADYIIDCSGRPKDYSQHSQSSYIPVNSVHVRQCYWDAPRFSHTLTIARPYGWVFGIPLQNRCSIGYLYNNDINTLEEVEEDIKAIFNDFDLTPSEETNSFSFKNYSKNRNFTDRVACNGNSSFFLEPLEAMSFGMANGILTNAINCIRNDMSTEQANISYISLIRNVERIIMMHYFAGSKYNTPFWEYAKERGERCMENGKRDAAFCEMIKHAYPAGLFGKAPEIILESGNASINFLSLSAVWWSGAFAQNLDGLGIRSRLESVLGISPKEKLLNFAGGSTRITLQPEEAA